jgi:hypothetical protein
MATSFPIGTTFFFLVVGTGVAYFILLWTRGSGPDSMWSLGRRDPVRNLFFRPDGSWKRYGRIAALGIVVVLLVAGYLAW